MRRAIEVKNWGVLVVAVASMLLTLPRFDRGGIVTPDSSAAPAEPSALADAVQYVSLVQEIRGEEPLQELKAPWAYRVLVPTVASPLPVPPLTAIDLICLLFVCASVPVAYQLISELGVSRQVATVGVLILGISFPVYYYGAIGYVDPAAIFFLLLGTLLALRGSMPAALATLLIGLLAKESVMLLIPVIAGAAWQRSGSIGRGILFGTVATVLTIALLVLLRAVIPAESQFLWSPGVDRVLENAGRTRAWLSSGLTIGVPLSLLVYSLFRGAFPQLTGRKHLVLWAGLTGAVALYIYSWFSAYVDGRMAWTMYPYLIPLSCAGIDYVLGPRRVSSQASQPS